MWNKARSLFLVISFSLVMLLAISGTIFLVFLYTSLPEAADLRDIQLSEPLKIYTRDGKLISEVGEKRRSPVKYDDVPQQILHAFMSAEDVRFFDHSGVDMKSLGRALAEFAVGAERQSGASTITMQVARNYFLSNEKTLWRKLREILLSIKIERELEKEEIFELYLNKIFLGFRSYGVAAAAKTYYNNSLDELSLAQIAMIAGLPKAPSRYNPEVNPDRAKERRDWILGRMLVHTFISQEEHDAAVDESITAQPFARSYEVSAGYAAEMARILITETDKVLPEPIRVQELYQGGYKIYTSIDSEYQQSANKAVFKALMDYMQRHGYRGAEQRFTLGSSARRDPQHEDNDQIFEHLQRTTSFGGTLLPAVVFKTGENQVYAWLQDGTEIRIDWQGLSWARSYESVNKRGKAPKKASDIASVGDLIRVYKNDEDEWALGQIPRVEGAFVAVNPATGALDAVVGGFHHTKSKFNRVTQSNRLVGSSIKPLIYAFSMVSEDYTAATIFNDAPIVRYNNLQKNDWRPQNSNRRFNGPTRLRDALYYSRNLVSVRLLDSLRVVEVVDFLESIGFNRDQVPPDLSLALGTASATPLQIAQAYTMFANGGHLVKPYLIERIEKTDGELVYENNQPMVCHYYHLNGSEVSLPDNNCADETMDTHMDPRVAYIMYDILRGITQHGTAREIANYVERTDFGGKTGTTNDNIDAWYSSIHPEQVAISWVGFDRPSSLGRREQGATAAMPIWKYYIDMVKHKLNKSYLDKPEGIVEKPIDAATGLLLPRNAKAYYEIFREELIPKAKPVIVIRDEISNKETVLEKPEDIF